MHYESQFGIWIDPSSYFTWKNPPIHPKAWENDVRKVLVTIGLSKVGRAVLNAIRLHGLVVRIVPDPWDITICSSSEATTVEGDEKQFALTKAIAQLNRVAGTKLPEMRAVITFTPDKWNKGGACYKLKRQISQYTPSTDEILLHELVHALRIVSKKLVLNDATDKGLIMYENDEEFFAVLVENMYTSELHSAPLRSSHTGFMEMDKHLQGSLEFFQVSGKAFEKVKKFAMENQGLAKALSNIEVPFNPLNAYFCHTAKAREMSRSSYAKMRDLGPVGMVFAPLLK
ncbi:MAG: hypothetical protein LAP86_08110 [Acidobacteriia bacterium]|nr:hypothetical protein [Terriglobia bacterium]